MTDITERLRNGAALIVIRHNETGASDLFVEAADQIEGLRDEIRNTARERDEASRDWERAMRRVTELEAQRVPDGFMAWLDAFVTTSALAGIEDHEEAWTWPNPPSDAHFFDGYPRLTTGDLRALHEALAALNAAPAPSAPAPVAYLDIGAGGYTDVGSDLSDEQLSALPKGRHMLGIIGTYDVDGYSVAQGWDAQAYASMRDEIEYWKRRAEESDEALERISNDLSPTHMDEPANRTAALLLDLADVLKKHRAAIGPPENMLSYSFSIWAAILKMSTSRAPMPPRMNCDASQQPSQHRSNHNEPQS